LYEASGSTVIPPYPVERVVDPVGAGDAFAAGLICGLLRGWPLSEGAALGALLGAAAVTTSGDWEHAPVAVDPARLLRKYQEALR
jgi:2-dehydro-3-deoxygluconokinase